jgi:hypothetical protein
MGDLAAGHDAEPVVVAGDLARDPTALRQVVPRGSLGRPRQKSADVTSRPRAVLAVANLVAGSAIPPRGAAKLPTDPNDALILYWKRGTR